MVRLSLPLAVAISRSQFFQRLVDRLGKTTKAVVKLNLLRITKVVIEAHPKRGELVSKFGMAKIVERLSKDDGAVMVRELAKEILP